MQCNLFNTEYMKKVKDLDLHYVKHSEVENLVEKYVMYNEKNLPLKIITGNSAQMKEIVINVLKLHKYKYKIGEPFNQGYITVLKG